MVIEFILSVKHIFLFAMLRHDSEVSLHPACPFCSATIAEAAFMANARFLALHNIAPVLPGHALVVPRRHASSILAISDDDFSELFIFARMVTHVLMEVFSADGFDWTIQDGVSAGQTVAHAHIHVIPRHLGDLPDPGDWYPLLVASETRQIDSRHRQRLDPQEHARITTHLKACAERIGAANS